MKAIYPMIACLGCAVTGMLWGAAVQADEGASLERLRTITVVGNAEVQAEPDRAFATFGIESDGKTAQEAQSAANEVMQRVLESLRRLGVPPRNIQTSGLTLRPVYEPPPSPPREDRARAPRIVAYHATNTLTVLVEDLRQVGPIIDAAMAAGANTINGVRFALADDLPQREQALRGASAEARRKAEVIAMALGVSLGPLRSASENLVRVVPAEEGAFFRAAAAAAPTPVASGQITIQATVNVVYDVGAGK